MLRGIFPPAYHSAPSANRFLAQATYNHRLSLEEIEVWAQQRITMLIAEAAARATGREPPPRPYDEFDDPAYEVPLVLDGWVLMGLTVYTETRSGGSWVLYWLDAQGQLGVSYQGSNYYSPDHHFLTGLRASIGPAPTSWELPPR